jgi:5-methylcytosine-specific restriction protein A
VASTVTAKVPAKKPTSRYKQKTEDELLEELFAEDLSMETGAENRRVVVVVQKRNSNVVAALKALYRGECQLTGREFVFKKVDGELYCEVHHLIPLGEGGADSPYNLIIVSPLIHRMLHYADVPAFDLSKIINNKLEIKINGKPFTITWHPKHAELVLGAATGTEQLS